MKIRAAVAHRAAQPLVIEDLELVGLQPDEVRVRIAGCGICHTDYAVLAQHFFPPISLPIVLGHEGSGIVEAVGSAVSHLSPGDSVVLSLDSCGQCTRCRTGRPSYCDAALIHNFGRQRRDGSYTLFKDLAPIGGAFFGQSSFATHAIARATNAIRVSSAAPIASLGPLGCGLQTGAGAIFNVIRPQPGSGIAILGVGTVGLAAVMAAKFAGCDPIIAVDRHANRLEWARKLGATHVLKPSNGDLTQQLEAFAPDGLDAAVDTTAVPEVFAAGIEALRTAGTMVLLGAAPGSASVQILMNSILPGRIIRGSIQGDATPAQFIPMLLDLHLRGHFPFDQFITYYPFEQINQALHDTTVAGTVIKAVVLMTDAGVRPSGDVK